MAEYIKREVAVSKMRMAQSSHQTLGERMSVNEAVAIVEEMPAADVAEVVRCKDCEFSRELTKTEKRIWLDECRACESPEAPQNGYMIVFPDDFCSYGELQTNGGGSNDVSD